MEQLAQKVDFMSVEDVNEYLSHTNLAKLHKLKLYLDDLYYNTGESTIADYKYDIIKNIIKQRDPLYEPAIGAKLRKGENRTKLPYWMGSANKITPEEPGTLRQWLIDNKADSYIISEKLDGVSCLMVHENNQIKLYTRGDGEVGADISYLAPYFHTIPNKLSKDIVVRGELIIQKKVFEQKYKNQTVNGKQYKNPRNMVAGLVSGKIARKGLEDIMFVVYEIVGDSMPKPSEQLKALSLAGFTVVRYEEVKEIDIRILSETLLRFRDESKYEIDGIIVQSNEPYDRNTSGNPEYMFAFKMLMGDTIYQTTVKEIEWNISKWGQLKPVIIVEPVQTGGVTISRATAHNAKYIEDNSLGPGAVITITRSKEVIPYIVAVLVQAKSPQMPTVKYVWDKNHINISVKEFDNIMCVKVISNFFAQLGIKHVSEATVHKMIDNGLDNLLKIIGADKQRLLQVPEFQEKSAERIYTNIHDRLQNVKLSDVLGASGVFGFGMGVKRIDTLLHDIPDLLEIYKTKPKDTLRTMILDVEGFSDIMADKIIDNLKFADIFIQKISQYAIFKQETRISDAMKGHKYVMTGFRDKKLEEQINNRGGKVIGTVSKNTTAVIVAKKESKVTGKLQKANKLRIPIYEKNEFIKQFIL